MAFDPAFTLLALAALAGFYLAWNIGANDVANAMGTAVGSGAIRLATALVIAGVFEFAGAMLVGDTVSQTLERGVIDAARFDFGTRDYAIGLAVALSTAGGWLNVASSRGWPVSTTHSIVGALVGAGIAGGGFDAVRWPTVGIIAVTWVVTPILGGLLAYALFRLMQSLVLDARSPLARLRWWGPVFVAPIFATVAFAAEFRTPALLGSAIDPRPALVDAALVALVSGALVVPLFLRATRGAEALSHNESMVRAERVFGRLQILTACFIAFAHGSNDVANAVGPLA
ncbi:MAG: inorganic phosphate transporter, partial [Myxococcales bacterium]|nr:inorganic phosphate transporter [Myxococcales bacterium]